jgi:hypothetical protein
MNLKGKLLNGVGKRWQIVFKFKMRFSAFWNLKSNRAFGSGYFT